MLWTQNVHVFVKFVFDLDHRFAPRNPKKYTSFWSLKNGATKHEKSLELASDEIKLALSDLEKEGIKVYPQPKIIKTIQNKCSQKKFYKKQ